MRVLDLFSGIGGFSLGLERAGMQTAAFCEVNEFCRKVLRKHWPDVPIFEDVRTLRGKDVGTIDLICGGYPCQPFSLAGERRGQDDDRHLWPEMFRLLQETRAPWLIGENVAGHISMGLDQVLLDLESENYEAQPFVIPACAIDAPHRRDRVWIVAHARGEQHQSSCHAEQWQRTKELFEASMANAHSSLLPTGCECAGREERGITHKHDSEAGLMAHTESSNDWSSHPSTINRQEPEPGNSSCKRDVCHTHAAGLQERKILARGEGEARSAEQRQTTERTNRWPAEPGVDRVAHGVPGRVDRLKALGNAVVPQIPEVLGRAIMAAEDLSTRAIAGVRGTPL